MCVCVCVGGCALEPDYKCSSMNLSIRFLLQMLFNEPVNTFYLTNAFQWTCQYVFSYKCSSMSLSIHFLLQMLFNEPVDTFSLTNALQWMFIVSSSHRKYLSSHCLIENVYRLIVSSNMFIVSSSHRKCLSSHRLIENVYRLIVSWNMFIVSSSHETCLSSHRLTNLFRTAVTRIGFPSCTRFTHDTASPEKMFSVLRNLPQHRVRSYRVVVTKSTTNCDDSVWACCTETILYIHIQMLT